MKLFAVPSGKRIRLTSKRVIFKITEETEKHLGNNITWEGTVTGRYYFYEGKLRRLVINPSINFWGNTGVWQANCDCEII